jgi:hypothetical protein
VEGQHEHHYPTPPVVDPGALYSGPERRRTDPLTQAITQAVTKASERPAMGTQPADVWHIVRDACIVALALLSLLLTWQLSRAVHRNNERQTDFRDGVACFLVETVQAAAQPETSAAAREKAANDILRRCGFIETPGNN